MRLNEFLKEKRGGKVFEEIGMEELWSSDDGLEQPKRLDRIFGSEHSHLPFPYPWNSSAVRKPKEFSEKQ